MRQVILMTWNEVMAGEPHPTSRDTHNDPNRERCQPLVGLSVLIIEDDADHAEFLAIRLRRAGHDVQIAYGGQAALRMAFDAPPDVALIDLAIPGMDGCAVAQSLRNQCHERRPLLVAMSGQDREFDRKQSLGAGFDMHLATPADPHDLLALLARFREILSARPE